MASRSESLLFYGCFSEKAKLLFRANEQTRNEKNHFRYASIAINLARSTAVFNIF